MRRLCCIMLACLAVLPARAQALPSLLIPTDCRSLAMGGTRTAQAPAGLDFDAYYALWAPSTSLCNIFGADISAMVMPGLSLTADIRRYSDRPYEIASGTGAMGETFKPYDFSFSVGAEYCFRNVLLVGLDMRNTNSSIAKDVTGSAVSGDVYAGVVFPRWNVMLAARNIGTAINYGYGDYALPGLIGLSGGLTPVSGLELAAEADYLFPGDGFSGGFMAGAGAEYSFRDMLFVRAGYHFGGSGGALPDFASFGLGGLLGGFYVDASVLLLSPTLGGCFMVSLGYCF